jgi:hypothetical protein
MAIPAKITRMTKICAKCGVEKPITEFRAIEGGRYRVGDCADCARAYQRNWAKTEKGRASINKKDRNRYAKNPERGKKHAKDYRARRWERILDIYGRACACCGETEQAFLTIDHLNNDGTQDRKFHGGNENFRNWLQHQPKLEQYQTLCWNCQWGRRIKGICPHQIGKRSFSIVGT